MNRYFRTILASLALSAGLMFSASQAEALSFQEITTMSGQGLSDDVLITIINSADDLPNLTAEDENRLKEAGISERVIQAMRSRYDVLHPAEPVHTATKETAAPQETVVEIDPEKTTENTIEPEETHETESTADESITVPVPVVGDETVLAPVESSNIPLIFQKFFEEAYETYTVQAEVARRYARLQSDTANERAYDSEVPKVLGYIEKIGENPISALESCLALTESMNPPIDSPLGATLNQCTGLALKALNAPAMASVYLDKALQSKAKIKNYSSTLAAFFETAHATDYTSTAPLLFKNHIDEIGKDVQPSFLYFIAYSLVFGISPDTKTARQLLSNIPQSSKEYARAKILLATIAVRAPEFRFKTAAEHLTEAIKVLEKDRSSDAYEQKNLAWLALARIAYENRAFDMADEFYRNVDINSHHLRDALLEDAWGQLFAGNHDKALSLTHALRAPIFDKAWLPDLLIIEAAAYLGLCRYDMAEQAVEAFRSTTLTESSPLNGYIASTPARDFYNQIIEHAQDPASSPIPNAVYKRVLNDFTFRTLHRTIRLLSNERRELSKSAGANFTSLAKLQAIYDDAIDKRQQMMSTILAGIYDKTLSELHTLDISASQIAIEIRLAQRQREAECLKIVASGGTCETNSTQEELASFEKRDSQAYWKFDGEFWRDEIRSYVSGLTSLCPQDPSHQLNSDSTQSKPKNEQSAKKSGAPKPPVINLDSDGLQEPVKSSKNKAESYQRHDLTTPTSMLWNDQENGIDKEKIYAGLPACYSNTLNSNLKLAHILTRCDNSCSGGCSSSDGTNTNSICYQAADRTKCEIEHCPESWKEQCCEFSKCYLEPLNDGIVIDAEGTKWELIHSDRIYSRLPKDYIYCVEREGYETPTVCNIEYIIRKK